ncbi:hypothetical protein K466DRAFT_668189 [Polyporus arcularius HHB13444]|uniref:Uncharacterized protein n=1 Tax=Polyporus arcularius HHB13444 TaxID=1314778 RepID=A0A5C3NPI2_9APHY|nr:hypothetical protein K466DRAFT_668189 [Polyporus arcularius HHB13444]
MLARRPGNAELRRAAFVASPGSRLPERGNARWHAPSLRPSELRSSQRMGRPDSTVVLPDSKLRPPARPPPELEHGLEVEHGFKTGREDREQRREAAGRCLGVPAGRNGRARVPAGSRPKQANRDAQTSVTLLYRRGFSVGSPILQLSGLWNIEADCKEHRGTGPCVANAEGEEGELTGPLQQRLLM